MKPAFCGAVQDPGSVRAGTSRAGGRDAIYERWARRRTRVVAANLKKRFGKASFLGALFDSCRFRVDL